MLHMSPKNIVNVADVFGLYFTERYIYWHRLSNINVSLKNLLILRNCDVYFRVFLSSFWVHGSWSNGSAWIWTGDARTCSHMFTNASADGSFELLSWKQLPAPRHQVFQHTCQQSVSFRFCNCGIVWELLSCWLYCWELCRADRWICF